jgi:ParB-like chromosome segregation protein Spo0J
MPAFKILDSLNTNLLDVNTGSQSGLGRYLPDSVVRLLALRPIATSLQKPLSEAPTNPVALEFSLPDPISLGADGDLSLDAGVRAAVGVHHSDELLFPADDLRDAISVPSGTAYVSMSLAPRVKASFEGERGALAFGFAAGASVNVRYFQPFDVAGADPTLAKALSETIEGAVLPADVDDLAALPLGAFASLEGDGEVELKGSVELASVINPLATPSLPVIGSASISAGASLNVGAEFRASGGFELRVTKIAGDRIRLSYYKRAGSEISIDATAAFGVSATIRDSDVLKRLMEALGGDPKANLEELVNAGLNDEQIEALQLAVAKSIDRSVRVATELQFSSVRHGEALFAYDIDIAALTPEGRGAVESALRGRLTAINEAAKAENGPIRAVQTGILRRRERRVTWRINLFGIVNVRSVSELLRKGTLTYDVATGTLNAADEISSRKILVRTRPLESDGEKVRKLVFESMIVTAAYLASRVTSGLTLTCSSSFFESRRKTTSSDLRADYQAIIGLGLADTAERDRRIGLEHDFGASTFLVECAFDQHAADALFIGPQGPYSRDYYDRIGRNALLALIPADDVERAHRRLAVENEASWSALTAAGPAAARNDLARKLGTVRAEHIISDYIVIRWWSDAMHGAAKALMEMRQFLGGRTAQSLATDADFARKRGKLEKELADVVKESKSQFGDPWGILALDAASRRVAQVQVTLVAPKLTAIYTERILPAERVAPAIAARAAADDPLVSQRAAKRPFTAEERELLRRHAINLRLGAFSTDGEFQTDEADVQRIFTELLPAEIAERKAAGQKLRLLFYAHGGLTDERSGLEPVLARLKFWRQNNIYPISFVWETGLRETVSDILRGLTAAREVAARGIGEDLADAVLEVAGRPGGKRVWGQMKRSAEVAVLEGGGGAFVAQRTRDLWNAHHADLEIHAAGHSAGTIFHAQFLPALLGLRVSAGAPPLRVKTLHFLAPACTTAIFNSKLKSLVGPNKGIDAFATYTMNKSLEQDDTAGPYRKSLLYLVSRAFEPEQPTPIFGLEESIRQDVGLIRFFGLAGNQKQADLVFSKTDPGAPPRGRSMATRHGGFDDDAATMNSVVRRIVDAPDAASIVDYFVEPIEETRAATAADIVASGMERITKTAAPAAASGTASPVAAAPPLVTATGSARKALCVGIDKYGAPYDLAGCVNDATNWAKTLRSLDFDVTTLHDRAATRGAILESFGALVRAARPGDVIVFQFAGHGTQVDDLDRDEDDSLDEAFCPADFADGRLLIDDDIKSVVASVQPGVNLTCFIDCCHSGTITRALIPGARPGSVPPGSRARYIPYSPDISNLHRAFRESPEGRAETDAGTRAVPATMMREVCFSACQPHEVAYETAGAGQFTTRAVAALTSGASFTNLAFMEQVVAAFGPSAAQHPHLDCADDARTHPLLGRLGVPAHV